MARLIFKCPYIRGNRQAAHKRNIVRYIATREGVEVCHVQQFQESFIQRKGYLNYIAQRPRVQKIGNHGLFSDQREPLVLAQVAREIAEHPGNLWLPILSLKREDAVRLGYDKAETWQTLLCASAAELAHAMKIPAEQFRWYAAFHNEGNHPHVHMICYSADPSKGYLTKKGIEQIRSHLACQIFRDDLMEIYQQQTQQRETLSQQAGATMKDWVKKMQEGTLENPALQALIFQLSQQLKTVSGKKQYGYLRKPLKDLVDQIVDALAREPCVAAAYNLWYEQREQVLRTYRDTLPERLPLSQQKEFRRIKNQIIQEAMMFESKTEGAELSLMLLQESRQELIQAASRLLYHMGRIFQEQTPAYADGIRFKPDRKLKRKQMEKKLTRNSKRDQEMELR